MSSTWITACPYFHAEMDRRQAELFVRRTGTPVFRYSSIAPHFAVTYRMGAFIQHSLLRQNADATLDMLDSSGVAVRHYGGGLPEFLHILCPEGLEHDPSPIYDNLPRAMPPMSATH